MSSLDNLALDNGFDKNPSILEVVVQAIKVLPAEITEEDSSVDLVKQCPKMIEFHLEADQS
jgi:hypothetical protein